MNWIANIFLSLLYMVWIHNFDTNFCCPCQLTLELSLEPNCTKKFMLLFTFEIFKLECLSRTDKTPQSNIWNLKARVQNLLVLWTSGSCPCMQILGSCDCKNTLAYCSVEQKRFIGLSSNPYFRAEAQRTTQFGHICIGGLAGLFSNKNFYLDRDLEILLKLRRSRLIVCQIFVTSHEGERWMSYLVEEILKYTL